MVLQYRQAGCILCAMKNYGFTEKPVSCAVLMSGSGSNAEALIRFERAQEKCPYHVSLIATDAPATSRAKEIAEIFGLPLVEHDILQFYQRHGEESTGLTTPRRRELREKWSDELYEKIAPFAPQFACFAGFIPLSNIASCLPCLNVHPGDLTRTGSDGRRLYAGLHVLPVERAILSGEAALRSSVILVQPYTGDGAKEMDAGPVLGISAPLPIETGSHSLEELAELKAQRVPGIKCTDALRRIALEHIERLKIAGDHVILPRAAADFASGFFSVEKEQLYYKNEKVQTVEYTLSAPPECVY